MSKTDEQIFFDSLNEKQKRQYAALKANEVGFFGVSQVANRLGIHPHTIRVGQKELVELAQKSGESSTRIRAVGGGRKKN